MSNKTNRRGFLKTFGAASLGIAFSPSEIFAQRRKKSCVIIGAGFSGLAAAFKLKNAGWSVTILRKARDRIGGRVFSYSFRENKNLVCELGAEWVGMSHERVKKLCADFNIPLQKHQFDDYLLQGGRVSRPGAWGLSAEARAAFEKAKAAYGKLSAVQKNRLDRLDWWTYLEKIGFSDDDLRLRDLMDSTDFGESIRHVSAFAALAEYAESSEKNEMDYKMTGGNSRLAEEFARRIGAENIRLNTLTTEINQTKGIVTIKTEAEIFKADACICTIPTNSLLKIKFNPPLPSAQTDAAERLIYARICKNSVLCEKRFWNDENFSLVSDAASHFYFHSTQNQPGEQGILTSYAVGEKADVLAAQSDERRIRIVMRDLADFNENAPKLAQNIVSYAWQRDKFTDGAYALYRPGQWFGIRPILQKPHGKVIFAGEHLADWQGFMEGAVETGEAAAQNLI